MSMFKAIYILLVESAKNWVKTRDRLSDTVSLAFYQVSAVKIIGSCYFNRLLMEFNIQTRNTDHPALISGSNQ